MYGQINNRKHTKTFISRPFGNSLDLQSVGNLYFFAHGAHESVGKKIFFLLREFFRISFDGMVGKPETKTFFLFFFRPETESMDFDRI